MLVRRLLVFLVAAVRFMAVASPPTPSSTAIASRTSVAARDLAARDLAAQNARRLPGAHPVSDAARRRHTSASTASSSSGVNLAPVIARGHALVAWLGPIVALVLPPQRAAAAAGRSDAVGNAAATRKPFGWAAQQRLVGGAVAVLVLVASVVGVSPVHGPLGATGNVLGAGVGPRLAIGGGTNGQGSGTSNGTDGGFGGLEGGAGSSGGSANGGSANGANGVAAVDGSNNGTDLTGPTGFAAYGIVPEGADQATDANGIAIDPLKMAGSGTDPNVATQDIVAFTETPTPVLDGISVVPAPQIATTDSTNQGAFLSDGTILKPIAVDTTAPDARTLLDKYTVRKGDTLTSIAHHFGLSLVTVYWANHLTTNLKTRTDLKVGQTLSIPPVNGILHIVTDNETLTDISKRTGVAVDRIVDTNGLKQPTVFVGQWIIVPGAKAKPIPVAAPKPKPVVKPTVKPASKPSASRPSPKPVSKPARPTIRPTYSGGGWAWPAPGGHISQYYHYGHWAIDIADTYGNPVLAARGGVVTFAGWKNNGGGWQVWMSHGNGLYTTYNHMSSLTVGTGQSIAAGHQVGRIGMTGHATGPHLHFEVWSGPIWNGGTRLNPLNYV